MAENIRLEIVTPTNYVASEETKIVMAPGMLGEFGVLIGHTPFLTTLKIGIVRYNDVNGKEKVVFVNGGFAEALPDKVTILTESAERRRDIDSDRAQSARDRAQNRLDEKAQDIDFARARASLERALFRLQVIELRN
mmetsp:Transcript_21556/g.10048  ORF Transcript_21556/g.10048 Transcript_21556/m.10048 type:complete len:137 (+) Transcript_21556:3296-3706(+)